MGPFLQKRNIGSRSSSFGHSAFFNQSSIDNILEIEYSPTRQGMLQEREIDADYMVLANTDTKSEFMWHMFRIHGVQIIVMQCNLF